MGPKTRFAILAVIFAVAVANYGRNKTLSPVVEITTGKLQGIVTQTRNGKEIHEYLKIPFAKQPIGDLRFESPQPPESWSGTYDATEKGPSCIQISLVTGQIEGSEECLYLNVYTPAKKKGPLPVMVFLHGGAFIAGSANDYKPAYLLDEDVILVTTNYRLAALGFLSTGDGVVRGNMALKDQVMALRWVQNNIKSFGGDPTQVTLFGESAGSYSVGFQLLSPMSKGLYSKAIMQSGSPLPPALLNKNPSELAKSLAEKLNCPTEKGSSAMIDCMKKISAFEFTSAQQETLADYPLTDRSKVFVTSLETLKDENTFMSEEPSKVLKSGQINKVPLIIGVNEDEGLLFSSVIVTNKTTLNRAEKDWDKLFPSILGYNPQNKDLTKSIHQFYFQNKINGPNSLRNFTNLFSDKQFFYPTEQFVKEYGKHAPVRLYLYSYNAEFSLGNILAATQNEKLPKMVSAIWDMAQRWVYRKMGDPIPNLGVCHGDELQLLFNWPMFISENHDDYKLSKEMVKAWTDFAKGSDLINFGGITWPKLEVKGGSVTLPLPYLKINTKSELILEPFAPRMKFWEDTGL